jgi:hypothetical protein
VKTGFFCEINIHFQFNFFFPPSYSAASELVSSTAGELTNKRVFLVLFYYKQKLEKMFVVSCDKKQKTTSPYVNYLSESGLLNVQLKNKTRKTIVC